MTVDQLTLKPLKRCLRLNNDHQIYRHSSILIYSTLGPLNEFCLKLLLQVLLDIHLGHFLTSLELLGGRREVFDDELDCYFLDDGLRVRHITAEGLLVLFFATKIGEAVVSLPLDEIDIVADFFLPHYIPLCTT